MSETLEPPLTPEDEEELLAVEPVFCEALTYRATLETPAEYCENEALEGFELCEGHLADELDEWEPDPDYDWGLGDDYIWEP